MTKENLFRSVLLTSSLAVIASAAVAQEAKRPNFLFILVDDQDPATLGAYGDEGVDTPILDGLASRGVTFNRAYQMGSFIGAVSTASRTMIMTGRNVWQAQALRENMTKYEKPFGNASIVSEDAPEYNSLPAVFHRAGYQTFRTCKQGNSYEAANALFDERHDKVCRDGNDIKGSKWHADHAIDFLNRRIADTSDEKSPYFLFLGFSHPHDPRNGKSELLEKYGAENIDHQTVVNDKMPSLPLSYLPEKPFEDGHPELRDEIAVKGVMTRRDEATIRNEKGKEYACIENIDIQIGRVLEVLEQSGEMDNTYIIFTSDHGIAVGKHAYMGKQNLFDHSFRVPFIVSGPNVDKGKKRDGNIYLMDLLPSVCDLAGIEAPECVDGVSWKGVVEGDKKVVRDVNYGAYSGGTKPGIRTVVDGDWKLIKYDVLDGTVRETLLFNLKDNPEELMAEHHAEEVVALTGNKPKSNQVNLADNPKYAKRLAQMEALLLEKMEETGDPYRLWNQK